MSEKNIELKDFEEAREVVKVMSTYGVPQRQIAAALKTNTVFLHTHFKEEMSAGQAEVNLNVAKTLYQKAISGNVPSLIFWAKTRLGWRETNDALEQLEANNTSFTIQRVIVDKRTETIPPSDKST